MSSFKEKIIISIVGATNVGKSSLFNLITGQKDKAIVSSIAGTTADNVKSLMEIHGLGKIKLIDTAGVDEEGSLGEKKKEKTKEAIGESDLVIFVVKNNLKILNDYEKEILNYIKSKNKKIIVIYNQFTTEKSELRIENYNHIEINVSILKNQSKLINFIKENLETKNNFINLLPNIKLDNSYVLLVIPIDEESPELRLLRPQSLIIERLLNIFAIPILYRPNLKKFDAKDFLQTINDLKKTEKGLSLIISDSQAIDKIYNHIPENINFTSFSIIMSNFMSNGNIQNFIKSAEILNILQENDKILIIEACNHDRKCNDIATVKLPNAIKKYMLQIGNNSNIQIDFNFGQSFLTESELKEKNYKLAIMCGGCMIDKQKYQNRLEILMQNHISITNYGIVFSYIKNKDILKNIYNNFLHK